MKAVIIGTVHKRFSLKMQKKASILGLGGDLGALMNRNLGGLSYPLTTVYHKEIQNASFYLKKINFLVDLSKILPKPQYETSVVNRKLISKKEIIVTEVKRRFYQNSRWPIIFYTDKQRGLKNV